MSEMVERVAGAIMDKIDQLVEQGQLVLPATADFSSKDIARAAIEAMRKPTEDMLAAVEYNGTYLDWQAMIDEALK